MNVSLPLAEYKFVFRAIDRVSLPGFADPLWRSVFGLALRRMVCSRGKQSACSGCSDRFSCAYGALLMGFHRRGNDMHALSRNMTTVPPPLVFRSTIRDFRVTVPAGHTFSAEIILVGSGAKWLPSIIQAMACAGECGLGRKRAGFALEQVIHSSPDLLPRLLLPGNGETAAESPPRPVRIPTAPDSLQFTFLSPYLLKRHSEDFAGFHLLMQCIRRISLMHTIYAGAVLPVDFRHLKNLANQPLLLDGDLVIQKNYGCRDNAKRFQAITGWCTMRLAGLEELWPWLYLGQWLGVGKQAGKGFGRYQLLEI